jgi:hypothetical protein
VTFFAVKEYAGIGITKNYCLYINPQFPDEAKNFFLTADGIKLENLPMGLQVRTHTLSFQLVWNLSSRFL